MTFTLNKIQHFLSILSPDGMILSFSLFLEVLAQLMQTPNNTLKVSTYSGLILQAAFSVLELRQQVLSLLGQLSDPALRVLQLSGQVTVLVLGSSLGRLELLDRAVTLLNTGVQLGKLGFYLLGHLLGHALFKELDWCVIIMLIILDKACLQYYKRMVDRNNSVKIHYSS